MKKYTFCIVILLTSFLGLLQAQVSNGGFESGELTPWGGFKNGVVGAATTVPYSGDNCGRIEAHDGSLLQDVTVEVGKTYLLTFYAKWAEAVSSSFNFVIKEGSSKLITQAIVANETGWTENTVSFTPTQSTVKLLWYKGQVTPRFPAFYLDAVTIGTATAISEPVVNSISIGPNPTQGLCTINCEEKVGSYKVFDTSGQQLQSSQVHEKSFVVDLNSFENGIYLLQLSNGKVLKLKKN